MRMSSSLMDSFLPIYISSVHIHDSYDDFAFTTVAAHPFIALLWVGEDSSGEHRSARINVSVGVTCVTCGPVWDGAVNQAKKQKNAKTAKTFAIFQNLSSVLVRASVTI